jgi:hypothetical protein
MGQKSEVDSTPVGVANSNPILDTGERKVSFPNGLIDMYMATMMVESLYSQVNSEAGTLSS